MATYKPRYMITVTDEMFKKIEEYRIAKGYPTRSEATVELMWIGLDEIHSQIAKAEFIKTIKSMEVIELEATIAFVKTLEIACK